MLNNAIMLVNFVLPHFSVVMNLFDITCVTQENVLGVAQFATSHSSQKLN
jgi:hypothetical protein